MTHLNGIQFVLLYFTWVYYLFKNCFKVLEIFTRFNLPFPRNGIIHKTFYLPIHVGLLPRSFAVNVQMIYRHTDVKETIFSK